jgi:hypothetical protein
VKFLSQLEVDGRPIALARISLDLRSGAARSDSRVIFALSMGSQSFGSIAIPVAEIGVPLGYGEAKSRERSDDGYFVPDSIIDFTRSALEPDQPIYLSFETPYGFLPGLPWERLGTERLQRPILRLGAAPVRPVRSETTLDVAFCCSLPAGDGAVPPAQVVEHLISQIPPDLPQRARVHVFVEAELYPMLSDRFDALGHPASIRLYEPSGAEQFVNPRPSGSEMIEADQLENPWLLWMRDALRDLSLDGVHFVSPGYLGRNRPGLRFANSPVHEFEYTGSRVVGSRQINLFLEQVGAWAVAFSSPPGNTSVLGQRMLFDEVSRTLNGPAILHDIAADGTGHALKEAYWHIFAPREAPLPRSPALALATHPAWVGGVPADASGVRMQALVDEYSLQGRVSSLVSGEDTPSWVSAQQRRLEKTIAAIAAVPEADRDLAHEAGVLDALRFTADLVAKYAPQLHPSDASGDPTSNDGPTP